MTERRFRNEEECDAGLWLLVAGCLRLGKRRLSAHRRWIGGCDSWEKEPDSHRLPLQAQTNVIRDHGSSARIKAWLLCAEDDFALAVVAAGLGGRAGDVFKDAELAYDAIV